MPTGTVEFSMKIKRLDSLPPNGGTRMSVRVSALQRGGSLREGEKVSCELAQDRKTGKSTAKNCGLEENRTTDLCVSLA